jgi:hypothetical protein
MLSNTDILDVGETIYIWSGDTCSRVKKAKALEIAIQLNSENNASRGKIITIGTEWYVKRAYPI